MFNVLSIVGLFYFFCSLKLLESLIVSDECRQLAIAIEDLILLIHGTYIYSVPTYTVYGIYSIDKSYHILLHLHKSL